MANQCSTPQDASDLVFVPLEPRVESRHGLVWRKTLPTRQAQVFLDAVRFWEKAMD